MHAISISPELQYSYLDSGKPDVAEEYDTIIILHGHTFHNGTFERLLSPSSSRNIRVIAINRRGYPGTTPITEEEAAVMNSSSEDLIRGFLEQHGKNLAMVVDKLSLELDLPLGRNVTLCGWSLGNSFLVNILACIKALEQDVRDRLRARVKGVILWDSPSIALGVSGPPGGYIPLYDESIKPEDRMFAFAAWVSSYWEHGDLSSRDYSQLQQYNPPKQPVATTSRMSTEQLATIISPSLDSQVPDNMLLISPLFAAAQGRQSQKAFLDPLVREMWGNPQICHLMGDKNCWPVIYGRWCVENMATNEENVKSGLSISFKTMKGGNHFVMWDHPDLMADILKACILGDMTPIQL